MNVVEIGPCVLCGHMGRTFTDTNATLGITMARFLCRAHEPKPAVPVLSLLAGASADDLEQLGAFFDHIKGKP